MGLTWGGLGRWEYPRGAHLAGTDWVIGGEGTGGMDRDGGMDGKRERLMSFLLGRVPCPCPALLSSPQPTGRRDRKNSKPWMPTLRQAPCLALGHNLVPHPNDTLR